MQDLVYHPWSKKEIPPPPSFRVLLNLCFFCDLKAQNRLITWVCLLSEASAAAERMPACLLMGTSVIFYLFCNLNLSETISVRIQSIQLRHQCLSTDGKCAHNNFSDCNLDSVR